MRFLAGAAIAAAIAFACPSALALEDHGPPPAAGASFIPTDRVMCVEDGALDAAFKAVRKVEDVRPRVAALRAGGLCGLAHFTKPMLVVGTVAIGEVAFEDHTEARAWSLHVRAVTGTDLWLLWLEFLPGAPA